MVEKRMSKFLAGPGLFPIPCPIGKNPPMLSQFGPKLENLMMILVKAFLSLKHFTIMARNNLTKVTIVNPPAPTKKALGQFFVNNFCVSEIQTVKFFTLHEAMVTQISAVLSSPNLYVGRSVFFKK